MKPRKLFSAILLAALAAGCSQEEFVAPGNMEDNSVKNNFSEFVGSPFEGEINFSRDDEAMTRMGLTGGKYAFVEGDQVGMVWTNAAAINNQLQNYNVGKESEATKEAINKAKLCRATDLSYPDIKHSGYKYSVNEYQIAVKNGNETPLDGSYVWSYWAENHRIFSNTRMTYENIGGGLNWHMTDGQIFKGNYFAYFPYNKDLQATSKFRVKQAALQTQNSTDPAVLADCSNHILDRNTGLVWISQNIPASTSSTRQDISFIYPLQEQDVESGTANVVNIQMRPFSNILDTRLLVNPGTMTPANAAKIKIQSVELIANSGAKPFATTAAFDMSQWGSQNNNNGVFGIKYDNTDPKVYTWNVDRTSFDAKYVGEDLVGSIKTEIATPIANAGNYQRVQLMLLPRAYSNQAATEAATETYKLRITTDYGYIDIAEIGDWYRRTAGKEGVVVNPAGSKDFEAITDATDNEYKLNYVLAKIGTRATRYISFDADKLNFNNISISNKADLIDAITKWNELGKTGTFNVIPTKDCVIENLVWNETAASVRLQNYDMYTNGQPETTKLGLGKAEQAIVDFLAKSANKLNINGAFTLAGKNAIDADRLLTPKKVTLDAKATLAITSAVEQEFKGGLDTKATAKVYVANVPGAKLTVDNASNWAGEATVYAQGAINIGKAVSTDLSNTGTLNINGEFSLVTYGKFANDVDASSGKDGVVNLFAKANVNGYDKSNSKFTNNATINYVDVPATFDKNTIGYTNYAEVYATITAANQLSHMTDYLKAANTFGATDLIIEKGEINKEWNNAGSLTSFKRVVMDNVTLNFANSVTFSKAIVTINGAVTLVKNTTGATPVVTVKQFVLSDNATLTVKELNVNESALTIMNNNTKLYGYDQFKLSGSQPDFNGSGSHQVYDAAGGAMTW